MRRLLSLVVFVCGVSALHGQFKGGAGDGFSSSEVSIELTSLENQKEWVEVYPSAQKMGESIQIVGENIQEVLLISSLGQTYGLGSQRPPYRLPTGISEGFYVLSISTARGTYQTKMYVYP